MRSSLLARLLPLVALLLAAASARADNLDRDTLLTDAPAVAEKGTVRITGSGGGQQNADGGSTGGTGTVSGSIQWTPLANVSGDVGAYYQAGNSGPSARVRYQLLKQSDFGVDLSGGVRFKSLSFQRAAPGTADHGEIEFLVAAGRRFGQWDVVLNGAFGAELGGGGGKDIEVKSFAGYRFTDAVRAGIDFRLQAEVGDGEATTAPKVGRDFDLTTGPAVSWMVTKNFQLQALVGAAAPKNTVKTVPVGVLAASIDF